MTLPFARRSGGLALSLRCLAEGVAEHPSWQRSSVTPVFQQHLSVDDGVVDTFSEFPDAPATGREVMYHIFGQRLHGVGIKNGDVSGHTWTEQPAIVDAEGHYLGTFQPRVRLTAPPPGYKPPFSDEELARRSKVRTGRPLADIIRDLEAKYGPS